MMPMTMLAAWLSVLVFGARAHVPPEPIAILLRAPVEELARRSFEKPSDRDELELVAVIHARREVVVDRMGLEIEIRDRTGEAIRRHCVEDRPVLDAADHHRDDVRLHPGDEVNVRRTIFLGCYELLPGRRYSAVAVFEDDTDWDEPPTPSGVVRVLRHLESNRVSFIRPPLPMARR